MGDGEPFVTTQGLIWTRRPSPASSLAGMGPQVTATAHQWGELTHAANLSVDHLEPTFIIKSWIRRSTLFNTF